MLSGLPRIRSNWMPSFVEYFWSCVRSLTCLVHVVGICPKLHGLQILDGTPKMYPAAVRTVPLLHEDWYCWLTQYHHRHMASAVCSCSQIPGSFHKRESTQCCASCTCIAGCCSQPCSYTWSLGANFREQGLGLSSGTNPMSDCCQPHSVGRSPPTEPFPSWTCRYTRRLWYITAPDVDGSAHGWTWDVLDATFSQNRWCRRESRLSVEFPLYSTTNAFSPAHVTSCLESECVSSTLAC